MALPLHRPGTNMAHQLHFRYTVTESRLHFFGVSSALLPVLMHMAIIRALCHLSACPAFPLALCLSSAVLRSLMRSACPVSVNPDESFPAWFPPSCYVLRRPAGSASVRPGSRLNPSRRGMGRSAPGQLVTPASTEKK